MQLRYLYSLGTAMGLDFTYQPGTFTRAVENRTPRAVVDRLNIETALTERYPTPDSEGQTKKLEIGTTELMSLKNGIDIFTKSHIGNKAPDNLEISWKSSGDDKLNRADLYREINNTCEDKVPFTLSSIAPSNMCMFSKAEKTKKAIIHFRASDIASIPLPFGKSVSFRKEWPKPLIEEGKIDPFVDPDAIIPIASELRKHYRPIEIVCYSSGYRSIYDNMDEIIPLLPQWLTIEDFLKYSKLQVERFRRICELADIPYLEGEGTEETVAFIEDVSRADIVVTTWGSLAFSIMDFGNTHGRLWARVGMRQNTLHHVGLKSSRLTSIGLTEGNFSDLAQADIP